MIAALLVPGRREKVEALVATVRAAAETLEIEHLLDRKPGQLSGGQRQRVALGRAMVRSPAAFLMDEPLSNLDAGLRVHMRAELSELHRNLGTTFVYVTHDQAEALTMSDRMAVMLDGDILQVGAPDDVYQNPRDLRVAEFVGSPKINVMPGACDGSGRLSCLGIALGRRLASPASGAVSIGWRPEHLALRSGATGGCFVGRLVYKENLGSDVYLHIALEDGANRIIARVTPPEAQNAAVGGEMRFEADPGKAMVFGADGRRLPPASDEQAEPVA